MAQSAYNCQPTHSLASISLSSGINGLLLSVATTLLNGSIIYTVYKERKRRLSGLYNSPLLFTLITDFASGSITDMIFSIVHFIEWRHYLPIWLLRFQHALIFLTTGLALINVALQGFDRIYAIARPLSYRNTLRRSIWWWLLCGTLWLLSSLSVGLYFVVGFFSYLVTFTFINITAPVLLMFVVLLLYRRQYGFTSKLLPIDDNANNAVSCEPDSVRSASTQGEYNDIEENEKPCCDSKSEAISADQHKSLQKREENGFGDIFVSHGQKDPLPIDNRRSRVEMVQSAALAQFQPSVSKETLSSTSVMDANSSKKEPSKISSDVNQSTSKSSANNTRSKRDGDKVQTEQAVLTSMEQKDAIAKKNNNVQLVRRKGAIDKQIVKALLLYLFVFILTYAPTVAFIIYLNVCKNCHCYLVHVMRDVTLQFILAAALLRPLSILLSARSVRKCVYYHVLKFK